MLIYALWIYNIMRETKTESDGEAISPASMEKIKRGQIHINANCNLSGMGYSKKGVHFGTQVWIRKDIQCKRNAKRTSEFNHKMYLKREP